MSESNQIREIFVREVTNGVTPVDSTAWVDYPISGAGGVGATPVVNQSPRVRNDRGMSAPKVVGYDINGSYAQSEFKADQIDPILEGVMCDTFSAGVLTNGTDLLTHSFERQFGDLTDKYLKYKGVAFNQFDLTFLNVRSDVLFSTSVVGMTHDNDDTTSDVGAGSIQAETTNRAMTVLDVSNVSLDSTTGYCISSGTLTVNNGIQPVLCAGEANGNATDLNLGTFSLSGNITLRNTDNSWQFLASRDSQDPVPFSFDLSDGTTTYSFSIPTVHLNMPDPTSAGANAIVYLNVDFSASQADGSYTMQITKS